LLGLLYNKGAFVKGREIKQIYQKTMKMNAMDWVAFILVIIGALNWGLVGAFNYNLVDSIFGIGSVIARIIYVLVGLSALYLLATSGKMKKAN